MLPSTRLRVDKYGKFVTVKKYFESLQRKRRDGIVPDNTMDAAARMLEQVTEFFEMNPDEIIIHLRKTKDELGETIEPDDEAHNSVAKLIPWLLEWSKSRYEDKVRLGTVNGRDKIMKINSAIQIAHGPFRKFLAVNKFNTRFWPVPEFDEPQTSKIDESVPTHTTLAGIDDPILDRTLLRQFFDAFSFRNKLFNLVMLSSSQDQIDVKTITVGDVRRNLLANGYVRFYWSARRIKTGIRFKTFCTKETSALMKDYYNSTRVNAKDEEPFFVHDPMFDKRIEALHKLGKAKNFVGKSVNSPTGTISDSAIRSASRAAHKKIGKFVAGQPGALRGKRMRKIFISVAELVQFQKESLIYTVFTGQGNEVQKKYIDKDRAYLEKVYERLEPHLSIWNDANPFTGNEQVQKLSEEVVRLDKKLRETTSMTSNVIERSEQSISMNDLMQVIEKQTKSIDVLSTQNKSMQEEIEKLKKKK